MAQDSRSNLSSIADATRRAPLRLLLLTMTALCAFAANSLLCRAALKSTAIDPISFTALRMIAGALLLWLMVGLRAGVQKIEGSWGSALALLVYAFAFSFAYVSMPAGSGALLLFGAVQATMVGVGWARGERLGTWQGIGCALAFGGLIVLVLPGVAAPPLFGAALMIVAGASWGIYSLRGKGSGDPTRNTAGNFIRMLPLLLIIGSVALPWSSWDARGAMYAVASGALASALGYIVWYRAMQGLSATSAAAVQLSVPLLAAAGGIVFLGEMLSVRLLVCSVTVLGGIALVVWRPKRSAQ